MEYPSPASIFFFSVKQTLCKKCEIYYERERANSPNILVSLRKRGNDDLEHTSLYTHSHSHASRLSPSSWPSSASQQTLSAGGMSAESEQCGCKSPIGSLALTTRLIQTPALSIVHPPWLFPAKVSMTQVPPCSLEGLYCSQIERTYHLEFFFPLWLNLIFLSFFSYCHVLAGSLRTTHYACSSNA